MIDVKCSVCNKDMQMPVGFLKKIPDGKSENIPHICSDCTNNMGEILGDENMKNFSKEINEQLEKLGKKGKIADKIAEEITDNHIDVLLNELEGADSSEEDKIAESFFRGAWTALFIMANNHDQGFLEKEAEGIRDFHKKMMKRENKKEK